MPDLSKIRHERELQFAKTFFDHDEWEFQPGPYRLSDGTSYTPDFLDKKRGVLIEVVGTRQAFSSNKGKYSIFCAKDHGYDFEFRSPDGELCRDDRKFSMLPFNGKFSLEDIKARLAVLIELPDWSLNRVAKETGIQQASLWRFVNDENYKSLSGQNIERLWPLLYQENSSQTNVQN